MKTPLNELLDFLDTQEGIPNIRVLVNQLGLLEKEKYIIERAYNEGYYRDEEIANGVDYFKQKFGLQWNAHIKNTLPLNQQKNKTQAQKE